MVTEKQGIDYQVNGFDDGEDGEDEGVNSLETNDEGELSFDYRSNKPGLDAVSTSRNSMEVNLLIRDVLNLYSLSQHKPMQSMSIHCLRKFSRQLASSCTINMIRWRPLCPKMVRAQDGSSNRRSRRDLAPLKTGARL